MNYTHFSRLLIEWYEMNQRDLPWRKTRDAYFIWLSEIILQQTRVQQGLPYYLKFIKQYPTVQSLANAAEGEVLRLWQGLGYYSRARNMHATANIILKEFDGVFPPDYKGLLKLKGIGKYTAGAIASFAFNERVPVVDGNVMRVLSRYFGIDADISNQKGQKVFIDMATNLLPEQNSEIFNQAIMEFGAIVCVPKSPKCEDCIFKQNCFAFNRNMVASFPVKTKKMIKKERKLSYFVIKHKGKLLMHRRESKDIWKGLYQFYLKETHSDDLSGYFPDRLLERLNEDLKLTVNEPFETYSHVLTHQVLKARYWQLEIGDESLAEELEMNGLRFYDKKEVDDLPKPILIQNYLDKEYF